MKALTRSQERCLETLSSCSPKELCSVSHLRSICERVNEASFDEGDGEKEVSLKRRQHSSRNNNTNNDDDVDRLCIVFTACAKNGLANVILHYIDEICNDASFVSADGVEATLRDGACVLKWAEKLLRETELELEEAMKEACGAGPSSSPSSSSFTVEERMESALAVFEITQTVFEALGAESNEDEEDRGGRITSMQKTNSERAVITKLNELRDDAINFRHKAEAAAWACSEGLLKGANLLGNKFQGLSKWANETRERRENASKAINASNEVEEEFSGLFVDVLLKNLAFWTEQRLELIYPFKSVPDALYSIWDSRASAHESHLSKKCLFLYYLLDAGLQWKDAPARYARRSRISAKTYAEIRLASLLDESWKSSNECLKKVVVDEALPNAATLAGRALPLQFLEVVHLRGETAAALRCIRARDRNDLLFESVEKAALDVSLRLGLGLIADAFISARDSLSIANRSSFSDIELENLAEIVTFKIAEFCSDTRQLDRLIALPLQNTAAGGVMERAFLKFLWNNLYDVPAEHTILYFLERGRTIEAIEAYARLTYLEKRGSEITWGHAKADTIEMLERLAKEGLPDTLLFSLSTDGLGDGSIKGGETLGREMERMKAEDKLSVDVTIWEAVSQNAQDLAPTDFVLRAAGNCDTQPSPFLRPHFATTTSVEEIGNVPLTTGIHRLAISPFEKIYLSRSNNKREEREEREEEMLQVVDNGANVPFSRRVKQSIRSESVLLPVSHKFRSNNNEGGGELPPLPSLSPLAMHNEDNTFKASSSLSPLTRLLKGTKRI